MEDGSRFCVGFYCVFRSTQPTVVIESIIELTLDYHFTPRKR